MPKKIPIASQCVLTAARQRRLRHHHLPLIPLPEPHTIFKIHWLPSAMSLLSCYEYQACVTNPHQRSCRFILSKDAAARVQNSTHYFQQIRGVTKFLLFLEIISSCLSWLNSRLVPQTHASFIQIQEAILTFLPPYQCHQTSHIVGYKKKAFN